MGFCWIPDEGKEKAFNKFQVLTNVKGVWTPIFNKFDQPCNSLKITEQNHTPVYSGRQHHPLNTLILGQVVGNINYITYGGHAYSTEKNYEIFTAVPNKVTTNYYKSRTFKLDGNYITLRLKSDSKVGTLKLGSSKETFEINISFNNTKIDIHSEYSHSSVANIISHGDFRNYWIYWNNSTVWVGEEGKLNARLKHDFGFIIDLKFFQIYTSEESLWELADFEEV